MARHRSGFSKDGGDSSQNGWGRSKRAAEDVDGHPRDAGEDRGLCANCAKRETCLLPKSEGGVWHCEEYVEDV